MNERKLAASLSISPATLRRRKKAGYFNTKESDTLYRFITVYSAAIEVFSRDQLAVSIWLQSSVRGLGWKKPIDLLSTSVGSDAVTTILGRLEYGVFS